MLIAAARDGDATAFEVLVRRHQPVVYRVALRMVGSRADAEDVAQETFVQAWRSLGRFRGESAFSTWLYRIATNRALDMLARRPPEARELDAETIMGGKDPSVVLVERERLRAVTAALLKLPARSRALLVLHELEGLSYDEVAEVLDIPRSTVKGRTHRARVSLVTMMEGN